MAINLDYYRRQLAAVRNLAAPEIPDYGALLRRMQPTGSTLVSAESAAKLPARPTGAAQPRSAGKPKMRLAAPPKRAGSTSVGNARLSKLLAAISGQESGNNYAARNPDSGALGRYQIMPGNIPAWSREALGNEVTIQQFLNNPKIQDAIAQYKLRQYVDKYGVEGAAAAWYGGPGAAENWSSNTAAQGAYPSVAQYVAQVMKRME